MDVDKKMLYKISSKPRAVSGGLFEVDFSEAKTADTLDVVPMPVKVLRVPAGKVFDVVG